MARLLNPLGADCLTVPPLSEQNNGIGGPPMV